MWIVVAGFACFGVKAWFGDARRSGAPAARDGATRRLAESWRNDTRAAILEHERAWQHNLASLSRLPGRLHVRRAAPTSLRVWTALRKRSAVAARRWRAERRAVHVRKHVAAALRGRGAVRARLEQGGVEGHVAAEQQQNVQCEEAIRGQGERAENKKSLAKTSKKRRNTQVPRSLAYSESSVARPNQLPIWRRSDATRSSCCSASTGCCNTCDTGTS